MRNSWLTLATNSWRAFSRRSGGEPRTLVEVAASTRVDQATLGRMVRALGSRDMFREDDGRWELTGRCSRTHG